MTPQYPPKHPGSSQKLSIFYNIYIYIYHVYVYTILLLSPSPGRLSGKSKNSKFLGMVRDALGGVRGSSLSNFDGFLNIFEKLNFQKLKIGRNRFKMG